MTNFIGIDLGTTNSAIASYDGENVRLYKSPEQHDVTPSAIFIDRRGNKYIGSRAYQNAARSPDNAAILFKRFIGTSTPIKLSAVDLTLTPEECSSEILKTLYGYLTEEIRNDDSTAIVITVPAAFNQMQKDATLSAAEMAGIGKVALMQEPVAAVMSVMRQRNNEGIFLIFDLGGGTLDIAIAESISGRVSLLAHGGIAMCGGRDFDRILFDNIVKPWLQSEFNLPEDFSTGAKYKPLIHMSSWAAEKAKIDLSSMEETVISLSESELGSRDLDDNEVYLDININREQLSSLIDEHVNDSITAARETLEKAGLTPHDVERIVFVGGPTHYKPLRDKVSFELGIAASTDVNPMTAVSEGAAIFAESIDWSTQSRGRKSTHGTLKTGGQLNLSFNYVARTPDTKAKIAIKIDGAVHAGSEFQVDSPDTGWTSGRISLENGSIVEVTLTKSGENTFKIFAFDPSGGPIKTENNIIKITRTAATIDAIPASSSVAIEVLDKLGGRPTLEYLVREGDSLPSKGTLPFKAAESLRAGGSGALRFKLWEGDIADPIMDNRFIGELTITGADFDDGVITQGSELICDYEVLDSGNIVIEVSVPRISGTFHSGHNFYSRDSGLTDFTDASKQVQDEARSVNERIDAVLSKVDDPNLEQAKEKLEKASSLNDDEGDPETTKRAMDDVLEAKKLLAKARKENLSDIRQLDLDNTVDFFNEHIRESARPTEVSAFDNLVRTAQRSINEKTNDFENHLDQLRTVNFQILWRQDWFVMDRFKRFTEDKYLFPDQEKYSHLVDQGLDAIQKDEIEKLRGIVYELDMLRVGSSSADDMLLVANILRG